ncbi:MAG: methylenetetrahydrofolate--tRNA-(uracil(54)-C(5))-methyltransferase (FADH(2)-oxidizing) TrmFO [Gemmatimonadetes bacterium]|nr:methylenetetrahydrofolate--tRNA-(uracil(54)-C(5))-methyltransferase (FADH(2)-oxidizing) TrmFO [Gemmatimonadota bacterium]
MPTETHTTHHELPALVIGGGLAGCEAAWQLARRGHPVMLVEMRPVRATPAHQSAHLAELVCTNSFKSTDPANAHGLLKLEMADLGSVLLDVARASAVPAGTALAVDRDAFARTVSQRIEEHPRTTIERREVTMIPDEPCVIATGPLTSDALADAIHALLGAEGLAFFDAIAPIVSVDSIDFDVAFRASRWGRGEGDDYINCPLNRDEYAAFLWALRAADVYPGHDWEKVPYFEGCLPIEVMAVRGDDTLRFGPMRPVGLRDPRTGRRPWAVVQLRCEDRAGQMWNMVGFQTRLRTGEQRRVFRMIPGLGRAEFLRTGSIHRNTYLNFPVHLSAYGAPPARPDVIFAGQLTGVEGYMESAASGILAGQNLSRLLRGETPIVPPPDTMMGALMAFLHGARPDAFQPMNSNLGLLPPLESDVRDKGERRQRLVERARAAMRSWIDEHAFQPRDSLHSPRTGSSRPPRTTVHGAAT